MRGESRCAHSPGVRRLCSLVVLLFLPAAAFAQAAITGVVKDASGGVLPGVTVEAASPVLIERVRSVVTDDTGQYRIVDLRPGRLHRHLHASGIQRRQAGRHRAGGSFVATVNADLRVGALEETITVTGETPIVDVQSARVQNVIDRDVLTRDSVIQKRQRDPDGDSGTDDRHDVRRLRRHHGGQRRDGG